MIFPWYPLGAFGSGTSLALAVLIGCGFGFTLERGGFGSSRRLAAQFYFYDMTVFKVMFTAIVTAMLGLFGLARIGLVDLGAIWINPTFVWPQIVGGFLLGVGFVISGYCPGTAIVASASGKLDGLLSLAGVALGVILYALVYTPALDAFQKSGPHGRLLLSDLFHLDATWLALGVTLMAILAFGGAEKVEKLFAGRAEAGRAPVFQPKLRMQISLALLGAGLLLALAPRAAQTARAGGPRQESVAPLDLARDLVEGIRPTVILDLRDLAAFKRGTIPGSIRIDPEDLRNPATWEERLPKERWFVLLTSPGEKTEVATPPGTRMALLEGGYQAWKEQVLSLPPAPRGTGTNDQAAYRERLSLYSYFTGAVSSAPKIAAPSPLPAGGSAAKPKSSGGC